MVQYQHKKGESKEFTTNVSCFFRLTLFEEKKNAKIKSEILTELNYN